MPFYAAFPIAEKEGIYIRAIHSRPGCDLREHVTLPLATIFLHDIFLKLPLVGHLRISSHLQGSHGLPFSSNAQDALSYLVVYRRKCSRAYSRLNEVL